MKQRGFTIVEITVTVVVIAILISVVFFAYSSIQRDARDNTRRGNVAVITEALEKYYHKNGEYPSVQSLANNYVGNTGTVVAAKLDISPTALLMPGMPSGATNGILSAATPANNYVAYIAASSLNNAACQTSATGGCDEYTLKYNQENGPMITIDSRHQIP
jgi:prepilin-type N-terminal cleavage/methylation domain-containing protein